jgi:hypothetical protein
MPLSSSPPETKRIDLEVVRDETPRAPRGRPRTLTLRSFLKIIHHVQDGWAVTSACEAEGISYRNFRTRVAGSVRLAQRLREAEAVRLAARHEVALASIMAAGHQSWVAHAWFLERVWPEKYSLKTVEREQLTIELKTQPVRVIGLPAAEIEKFTGPEYERGENGSVTRVVAGVKVIYVRTAA